MAIQLKTVWNSPQANDDIFWWTEDELLALNYLNANNVITLDVMANDLGGSGKSLYSIDDGDGNFLQDMLDNNVTTGWENTASGNQIRIFNGMIEFDISHDLSFIGGTIDGLSAGESLYDSFTYSIQLGNGTLSWANVSIRIDGVNDGPVAVADTDAGDEDTTITGSVATNDSDPDHDAVLTYSLDAAVVGLTLNADGSYSFDAGDAAYQYLAAGEQLEVVADYTVTDEWGASSSSTLTINISGTDDAPVAATFSRTEFATGLGPISVGISDLNNDGDLDLVVANGNSFSTDSILLGNGDGTFQAQTTIFVGEPHEVVVGDLNGDGVTDIVNANSNSGTISVSLGIGDGTFQPRSTYAAGNGAGSGAGPGHVTLGDLNGDSYLDVIATAGVLIPSSVAVLLGNGDGTFQPQTQYGTGISGEPVEVGDLNGDGKLDVVVAGGPNVSVLLGNGDGSLQTATQYATGSGTWGGLEIADLSGDGILDIVTANGGLGTVSVLLGNGDGTFQNQTEYATGTAQPMDVAVGDLNGDGRPDLAVTSNPDSKISVLLGSGDGTFTFEDVTVYDAGTHPLSLEIADFNGDYRNDIVVTNGDGANVSIFLNTSDFLI
jgi:VCBS repeat-containing protein